MARLLSRLKVAALFPTSIFKNPHRAVGSDLKALDNRSKSSQIQSSIKFYLRKVQEYDSLIESEREDFERGRKFLSQMMGRDPETFGQEQIDEAIQYLFPSALFCRRARPKLKPTEEVFPARKKLQCDTSGRPLHSLFYTRHPNYYDVLHNAVYKLEELKIESDRQFINKESKTSKEIQSLNLVSSEWMSKSRFEKAISETVSDVQYEQWILLMNRITEHPLAYLAREFIMKYRIQSESVKEVETYPEPETDPCTNRKFAHAYGQRKSAFADVIIYSPGFGELSVNDKRLLEVFPEMGNREQIMFPLQLTKTLGRVDVSAKITGEGNSALAGALRLAISRGLASLLPTETGLHKLRVAGLLTQDERFAERKKPGQKKARKKPIWKAR